MSGREVNELVVALRPIGEDETTDAMENAQDSFEETAQVAEDSSEDLEEFSQRFTGAMSVAVGALSIAAGGLLSTVPVVGEAFAGLGAIIDSIGLRFDELLRDLGFSSDGFFELANAIAKAEGPVADFVTALGLIAVTLGAVLAPLTFLAAQFYGWGAIATFVTGAISTIVGGISLLTVGLAALMFLMAGLALAWITDWKGIRTTTMKIVDLLVDFTISRFNDLMKIAGLLGERVKLIFKGWTNAVHRMVVQAMNGIISTVESTINGIIRTINRFSNITGISLGQISLQRMQVPDRANVGGQITRNRQAVNSILDRQQGETQKLAQEIANAIGGELPDEVRAVLNIDGKQTAEATSRWRGTSVANRGR